MVEFTLEDGIGDTEAIRLIESPIYGNTPYEGWTQEITETQQTLKLDHNAQDPFTQRMIDFEVNLRVYCRGLYSSIQIKCASLSSTLLLSSINKPEIFSKLIRI